MSFGKKKLEKVIQQIINSTRQSYNAYLFKGCKRNSFLIASFITAFLISSLALTGILSNNLSQGTEKVSAAMILTASATSEGGGGDGDGDQGGGDGDQGGDQDDTSDDSGDDQDGGNGDADFQSDSDTEPDGTSETTEPELTPELSETIEPSPSPENLQELVEICDNGQDDDNDGQIDADDSDCSQQTSSILTLTPTPTSTPTLTPSPTPTPTNIQGLFGLITPFPTPTPTPTPTPAQTLLGLQPFEICNNGVDDDGDGGTDNGDHDCSPGAQGACPPGSPPTCIVFTGPSPSPSPSPSTKPTPLSTDDCYQPDPNNPTRYCRSQGHLDLCLSNNNNLPGCTPNVYELCLYAPQYLR